MNSVRTLGSFLFILLTNISQYFKLTKTYFVNLVIENLTGFTKLIRVAYIIVSIEKIHLFEIE
jgi:hypothetical protein